MGKYDINTIHTNNQGNEFKIIEKVSDSKRLVKFLDENGYETVKSLASINKGQVFNPYNPSVYGVGYIGVGKYSATTNGRNTIEYTTWVNMLMRVHNTNYISKFTSYKDVTICKDWYNFQVFAEWMNINLKCSKTEVELDKDLKSSILGTKVYSPDTCCFLPKKVNYFLNNYSKQNKHGLLGVCYRNGYYISKIKEFYTNKRLSSPCFKNKEDAYDWYIIQRKIQAEKVKDYMRSLGYYSEEIIQLIK